MNGNDVKHAHNFKDLSGQRFTRLVILEYVGVPKRSLWKCLCDCGHLAITTAAQLHNGRTKSCGCLKKSEKTHGAARKNGKRWPEYLIYYAALGRCESGHRDYGGRGIRFLFTSFEHFIGHVGRRPSPQHSLDRIDVNGHYEPGNVRWATRSEQARNRRNNIMLTHNGETLMAVEWAERMNLTYHCVRGRIIRGYCSDCVLSLTPFHRCSHQREIQNV